MSETHEPAVSESSTAVAEPGPNEPRFAQAEVEQFDADDVEAGRAIGKLLCFFFLYTIIAMSIAAWWTYASVE